MSQIIESLNGLGTKQNTMYTNQEIIDHLTELQGAMARGVFEKTHAENLRDRDIMIHFEALKSTVWTKAIHTSALEPIWVSSATPLAASSRV